MSAPITKDVLIACAGALVDLSGETHPEYVRGMAELIVMSTRGMTFDDVGPVTEQIYLAAAGHSIP